MIKHKLPDKLSRNWPYYGLALLFIINLWLVWPGQMTPDSYTQYQEALTNTYSAAHPPLMSFVWHLCALVLTGSGLVCLLHLLLLYGACWTFMQSFKNSPLKFYYLIFPLLPAIAFYSSMIWKDVGLAFSYLAFSSGLTYFIIQEKKPSHSQYLVLILLLFYGTAVKFQAIYTAPGLILGLSFIWNNFKLNYKTWRTAIVGYLILCSSVLAVNQLLETPSANKHWWQYVKIYDLAGISIALNQPLFPDYILQAKNFDFELIKQKFNYERVDDLVFFSDSPIVSTINIIDLQNLLTHWRKAVYQHPLIYLQHRWHNWAKILFAKPLEKLDTLDFTQFKGLPWLANLNQVTSDQTNRIKISRSQKLAGCVSKVIFTVLKYFRYLLSFIFVFIFIIFSLIYGSFKLKNNYGLLLFIFSLTSLLLVLALFPFTMASALRYVYMPVCLTYAAIPIAYRAILSRM